MYVLTLIFLSVSGVYCDDHTLRVCYMGVSAPGSGLPEFSIVGYVDDQQIALYNSDIRRVVPVAPWMHQVGSAFWEQETTIAKEDEALFRTEVKIAANRFNHTKGFHYVQVVTACELKDDGNTLGLHRFTYDGREFMYLDVATATYIPTMAEAQIITQRWNHPDARMGETKKFILENRCIQHLKLLSQLGREYLEWRVWPEVKVTGRESGEITKLHCQVYGFHPRAVDVKWMKNGIDDIPSYETTDVLPNPDGTYQIRVSVEVMPKENDSYSCYVDHSSLGTPLLVEWRPIQDSLLGMIIGAVVFAALVVIFVTAGVLIFRNEKMREAKEFPET